MRSTTSNAPCGRAGPAPDARRRGQPDDVLMTSAAYCPHVERGVAAGGSWANDSVSCPRSRRGDRARRFGLVFDRNRFQSGRRRKWWFDEVNLYGPDGLTLPDAAVAAGKVNRGNAAPGGRRGGGAGPIRPPRWPRCPPSTRSPGAIRPCRMGSHTARVLLAKNPPAGRRRCRWSTRPPTGGDRGQRSRCPTARTCPGCGTSTSNISKECRWSRR